MSMPSQPEVDRTGTDEPETDIGSPIVRSEIWFHDGNIVQLQAGRTQFKIYQGLLSANSTVFADMFSIPQPPSSGGDMVEGCAVIHLSDSAVDVTYVLEALCKRSHVTIDEPVSISIVAAFVRLGQKYQIDAVLSEALKRLYNEFPVELKDYDKRYNWDNISYSNSVNIDLANLAREQNLLSVLPHALQLCCCVRSDVTMQGVQREDNTIATLAPINERAVLAASHRIILLQSTMTFSWLTAEGSDECSTHQDCNNGRNQILRDSFFPLPLYTGLTTWEQEWEEDMCDDCVLKARDLHDVGRQKYWDGLPSTFGLPDWEELKKERVLSNMYVLDRCRYFSVLTRTCQCLIK